jgi:hypothetical protein
MISGTYDTLNFLHFFIATVFALVSGEKALEQKRGYFSNSFLVPEGITNNDLLEVKDDKHTY